MFSPDFIGDDGSAGINRVAADGGGDVGPPFANFETTTTGTFQTDLPGHNFIWRKVAAGPPVVSSDPALADVIGRHAVATDAAILSLATGAQHSQFDGAPATPEALSLVSVLFGAHDYIHSYIGGTFGIEHIASRDPIFYLVHSNLDRLWAMWQRVHGQAWRLDPNKVYGDWTTALTSPASTSTMVPWDGRGGNLPSPLIPWVPGSNADDASIDPGHAILAKLPNDPTVVIPRSYDTAPHSSYVVTNRNAFSTTEVGINLT